MTQIEQFMAVLKKSLKVKGVVYRDLAKPLGLSEASVKRILAGKSLSLDRLEEICHAAGISFAEICKLAEFTQDTTAGVFTDEQEAAFAGNPRLFHYSMLLADGITPQKILRDYDIKPAEAQKFLLTLDRLRLIELHPGDRVKIGVSKHKRFRKEGPMGKILFEQTRDAFLQSRFREKTELLNFVGLRMSPATFAKAKARLEKVMADIREDASFDDPEAPENGMFGVMVAMRPWKYAYMDSIRKK